MSDRTPAKLVQSTNPTSLTKAGYRGRLLRSVRPDQRRTHQRHTHRRIQQGIQQRGHLLTHLLRACIAAGVLLLAAAGPLLPVGSPSAAAVPTVIHGVNLDSPQTYCWAPWGGGGKTFSGPADAGEVAALQSWHINFARLALNEDCWLGINGLPVAPLTAATYRSQLRAFVNKLTAAGIYVELDLHNVAPGTNKSEHDPSMADAGHALPFWTQVATAYKSYPDVGFDLYNEPSIGGSAQPPTTAQWQLWRNGGSYNDPRYGTYTVAGMQQMIDTIRATGATNTVFVAGLDWAQDFDGWAAYHPTDPANNMVGTIHLYQGNNPTPCWYHNLPNGPTCWGPRMIAPLSSTGTKAIVEEFGEEDCAHTFVNTAMQWAAANTLGEVSWVYDTQGGPASCRTGWSLISNFETGAPTTYGQGVRSYYVTH